jgi:hypothetical protein
MRHEAHPSRPTIPPHDEREQRFRRRIDAFPFGTRPIVEKLARQSAALEDLAESFPAMLFALATSYGGPEASRQTLHAVIAGLPLKEAARRLGLPFWMRKLPAISLFAPIVAPPTDPVLGQRIVDLTPTATGVATCWLERVLVAHHTGHPELALWAAKQLRAGHPHAQNPTFLNVLAWAWFCLERKHPAGSFLTTCWSPDMGYKRAQEEARLWEERWMLTECLGAGLRDTWLQDGESDGLQFVALRTAQDFLDEAVAMDNCLDRYGQHLFGRTTRVFSIRRDGKPVASLEIAPHEKEKGHPTIFQLRGPHNRRAPLDVWQATYKWLGSQPLRLAEKCHEIKPTRATRLRRRTALRQPFLDALPAYVQEAYHQQVKGKPVPARPHAQSSSPSEPS